MLYSLADCHFGELPDDVANNIQGSPSPASHHEDEDRLEQDQLVQNRRRSEIARGC